MVRNAPAKVGLWAAAAAAAGWVATLDLPILVLIGGPVAMAMMMTPVGRLMLFSFGGLLAVGQEGGLSIQKVAFTLLALVSSLVSLRHLTVIRDPRVDIERLVRTMVLLVLMIVIAALGAIARSVPIEYVVRDAVTYVLIVLAVPIGAHAGLAGSWPAIQRVVALTAAVSAVGFTTSILSRRGVSTLDSQTAAFGSMLLVAIGIGLCLAWATQRNMVVGILLASVLIGSVLVTGTRTGFVLLVAIPLLALPGLRARLAFSRTLVTLLSIVAISVLVVYVLGPVITSVDFIEQRVEATLGALQGGLAEDRSAVERASRYRLGLDYWSENHLFGVGFGSVTPSVGPTGIPNSFYLDAPTGFLAKFGIVGSLLLMAAFTTLVKLWRADASAGRLNRQQIVVLRYTVFVWLLALPFSAIAEDKGFAFGVALLTAVGLTRPASSGEVGTAPPQIGKKNLGVLGARG